MPYSEREKIKFRTLPDLPPASGTRVAVAMRSQNEETQSDSRPAGARSSSAPK